MIEAHHAATLGAALADRRVWRLAVLYFVLVTGLYGVGLWLPQIVKGLSGLGDVMVGVVSAVPYVAAANTGAGSNPAGTTTGGCGRCILPPR